ncbi:hypothetical protein D9M71_149870 [compost metagenome]
MVFGALRLQCVEVAPGKTTAGLNPPQTRKGNRRLEAINTATRNLGFFVSAMGVGQVRVAVTSKTTG